MKIQHAEIEGLITELNAGKSLRFDEAARIHNAATDRAIALVRAYGEGRGLFSMKHEEDSRDGHEVDRAHLAASKENGHD